MTTPIHNLIADCVSDFLIDNSLEVSLNEYLASRLPNLTRHPDKPQTLYVQRFPNGTFGTKIFWSRVPGMNLVEFTQSEP